MIGRVLLMEWTRKCRFVAETTVRKRGASVLLDLKQKPVIMRVSLRKLESK